jgi:hypothetical protein
MVRSSGNVARGGMSAAAEELSCSTELVLLGIVRTAASDVHGPAGGYQRRRTSIRRQNTAGQNTVLTLFTLNDGDLNFAFGRDFQAELHLGLCFLNAPIRTAAVQ